MAPALTQEDKYYNKTKFKNAFSHILNDIMVILHVFSVTGPAFESEINHSEDHPL